MFSNRETGNTKLIRSDLLLKDVALQLDLDETLPRVSADPIQIQQIVLNLLMNGIDAVEERKCKERNLTVSSRRDESHVTISVRDSGGGIPESRLPKVFNPYESGKPDGLGMGLTVCRSLVEAHHGRIWVADTSRTGTTVSFMLPSDESELL